MCMAFRLGRDEGRLDSGGMGEIDLVINVPSEYDGCCIADGYAIRRRVIDIGYR